MRKLIEFSLYYLKDNKRLVRIIRNLKSMPDEELENNLGLAQKFTYDLA